MGGDRARTALRWVVTTVAVVLLVWGMIRLSQWQWHKHVARDAELDRIQSNRRDGVVPLDRVTTPTGTVARREQWRLVSVTGTWDPARQVVARLRTVSGAKGFEILTPVRTADGTAVLVDRGLLPVTGSATARPATIPAPPTGTVTVSGYLRVSEQGGSPPAAGSVRIIDVAEIAPTLPYPVLDGYLQLTAAQPADAAGFLLLPPPSQDPGPYLSYSVQWVIFAGIAVGGLVFLAVDEARGGRVRARLRAPAPVAAGAAPPPGGDPGGGGDTDTHVDTDIDTRGDTATATGTAASSAGAPRRRVPSVLAGGRPGGTALPDTFWDDDEPRDDQPGHDQPGRDRSGHDERDPGDRRPGP